MEFCQQGDFFDLVCNYDDDTYRQSGLDREESPLTNLADAVDLVPEPFLWSVFWSLATAGLLMEKGELNPDAMETDDWDVIVHRDLKLSNGTSRHVKRASAHSTFL
jgi:hypothetical protein